MVYLQFWISPRVPKARGRRPFAESLHFMAFLSNTHLCTYTRENFTDVSECHRFVAGLSRPMPGVSPSTAAAVAAAAAAVPLREPKASVPIDYSRYVRKFSSAAECGNNHCRDLNYRCVTTKILYS